MSRLILHDWRVQIVLISKTLLDYRCPNKQNSVSRMFYMFAEYMFPIISWCSTCLHFLVWFLYSCRYSLCLDLYYHSCCCTIVVFFLTITIIEQFEYLGLLYLRKMCRTIWKITNVYVYSRNPPILLYVYLWYPHISFRHLKVSPKNDGLVVELEDTDETCRRRKKRVSQFLNLVNLPISLLVATACTQGFVKSGTPKSLKVCYFQSRNYRFTGAPTLILYYICRVLRPSFVEIIPLHCQKPDTHRISCSGFRSVTDSIQNWVSFPFLMVRCYLFLWR
jgi:hypothetical protein